jgi:serine/threonine protein kinase
MADKKFQRFGKYLILDHLVDGGMAKICRARFLGEQADKLVAIKMVQPQFSKDPSFRQMFEDELKVTFALMHPNIAQTYDYGMVDDQLYTAMEYVDGANLKQFLDRLKKKNFVFPVEISTYITSQVCQALNYAHTFKDKMTGKSLNIIHRDISPHNIMLTYDGAVKVIDFGIAKADSNSEATQAGTIKGKLSYLAPEYLDGLALDPRYDEFAVGVTLWELLCSRRLFTAPNDLAVLKQIQNCKVPAPSSINPNVPKELDEIVLKALSKNREDRYEDMDKFNRALVKFLYSHYPDFNPSDLGYFAKQLFKAEIDADHKKFVEYGKIDIKPYIQEFEAPAAPAPVEQAPAADSGVELETKSAPASNPEKGSASKDSKTRTIAFADKDLKTDHLKVDDPAAAQQRTKSKRINRADATRMRTRTHRPVNRKDATRTRTLKKRDMQTVDDSVKKNNLTPVLIVAGVMAFAFLQPQFVESITGVNPKALIFGETKKKVVKTGDDDDYYVEDNNSDTQVQRPKRATISFVGYDTMMQIRINGQQVRLQGIDARVPINKELEVVVAKEGFKPFVKKLNVGSDNEVYNFYIPDLEKEKIGLLTTSLNYPTGSKLVIDISGQTYEKELPLRNERIPAGVYEAKVVNPLLGTEKNVRIKIEENKKHFLD